MPKQSLTVVGARHKGHGHLDNSEWRINMAQLPPDGEYLIQQISGRVVLFHRYTEEELISFDSSDIKATTQAQQGIHELECLNSEQKAFAHFWSGYFYACAKGM